ncbi:Fanconi-associated nuclease 1-like protein [Smittium culicis]|uniref:Fanconi-associated nuclease n=1 Tax=Smittium culicis TaxID=133412 RepID=A0A1R1YR19_9FUNG|nr:Fanconi-associated nuclease 1-like protein [Smittium culicis]
MDQKSTITTAILSSFGKLNFPKYEITRTNKMFISRESVINYVNAMEIEFKADTKSMYLNASDLKGWRSVLDMCLPLVYFWANLIKADFSEMPAVYPFDSSSYSKSFYADMGLDSFKDLNYKDLTPSSIVEPTKISKINSSETITSFVNSNENKIDPMLEFSDSDRKFKRYQRRFTAGWVLTRIAEKCSRAFQALNMYKEEEIILRSLLNQKNFRSGRRGKWYRRIALIQMNYLLPDKPSSSNLQLINTTNSISTPKMLKKKVFKSKNPLIKRDTLMLPDNQNDFTNTSSSEFIKTEVSTNDQDTEIDSDSCDLSIAGSDPESEDYQHNHNYLNALFKCRNDCLSAILDPSLSIFDLIHIDKRLKNIDNKLEIPENLRVSLSKSKLNEATEITIQGIRISSELRNKGESLRLVWEDNEGGACSVEQVALGYYVDKSGYTGVHSESSIVTTLFGLLFWDIIFYPVDGVFDTEFQTHPLDMHTDAFYINRKEMIDQRIMDIRNGDCIEFINIVYEREYIRQTSCIGINWDYSGSDLTDLANCLGQNGLAEIMYYLAIDYRGHASGVPDLW